MPLPFVRAVSPSFFKKSFSPQYWGAGGRILTFVLLDAEAFRGIAITCEA